MTNPYDRWLDEGLDDWWRNNEGEDNLMIDEDAVIICPYCEHEFYSYDIGATWCPKCKATVHK